MLVSNPAATHMTPGPVADTIRKTVFMIPCIIAMQRQGTNYNQEARLEVWQRRQCMKFKVWLLYLGLLCIARVPEENRFRIVGDGAGVAGVAGVAGAAGVAGVAGVAC